MQQQQQPDNSYAYAPNYNPNAGLFDRLKQGGPGALFGAPNGIFPGANGQPGYDLGNRLQRAAMFAMSVNHPEVLGALGQTNSHRKFVQIGADEYGVPLYGWVDESTGSVTPVSGTAGTMQGQGGASQGAPATAGTGLSSALADYQNGKLTVDQLREDPRISPTVRSNAMAMIAGTRPYPLTPRDPLGKMSVALANALAPGEDLSGRQAAAKAWAEKNAELGRRMGQAAQHGSELPASFDAMNNTQVPVWNAVKNYANENIFGSGAPTALKQNITQFASELATFTGGNTISDTRFKEWADAYPVNGSPEQQHAALKKGAQLFEDAIQAYRDKHDQAFGSYAKQRPDPVPQRTLDALARMKAWANGTQPQSERSTKLPAGVNSIKVIE